MDLSVEEVHDYQIRIRQGDHLFCICLLTGYENAKVLYFFYEPYA